MCINNTYDEVRVAAGDQEGAIYTTPDPNLAAARSGANAQPLTNEVKLRDALSLSSRLSAFGRWGTFPYATSC